MQSIVERVITSRESEHEIESAVYGTRCVMSLAPTWLLSAGVRESRALHGVRAADAAQQLPGQAAQGARYPQAEKR